MYIYLTKTFTRNVLNQNTPIVQCVFIVVDKVQPCCFSPVCFYTMKHLLFTFIMDHVETINKSFLSGENVLCSKFVRKHCMGILTRHA